MKVSRKKEVTRKSGETVRKIEEVTRKNVEVSRKLPEVSRNGQETSWYSRKEGRKKKLTNVLRDKPSFSQASRSLTS